MLHATFYDPHALHATALEYDFSRFVSSPLIARRSFHCPHFGYCGLHFRNQVFAFELSTRTKHGQVFDFIALQQLKLLTDRHDVPCAAQQPLQVANRMVWVVSGDKQLFQHLLNFVHAHLKLLVMKNTRSRTLSGTAYPQSCCYLMNGYGLHGSIGTYVLSCRCAPR